MPSTSRFIIGALLVFGFGIFAAFLHPTPTLACTTPTPANYYAVGDSIAKGLMNTGMPGTAIEGIGPSAILSLIGGLSAATIHGTTVVLSSGASNAGCAVNIVTCIETVKQYVPQQIAQLKKEGAKVILLGVGSAFTSSPLNPTLQTIASQAGATFTYIGKTGTDGVHPDSCTLLSSVASLNNLALQSLAQDAIKNADPGTATGADQLETALKNFGVSADDAHAVVTNDAKSGTTNSKDLLNAFISQDPSQISDAANAAHISLNDATINDITSLSPSQLSSKVSNLYSADQQTTAASILNSPSTFAAQGADQGPPGQTQQCGVSGIAGNMMLAESYCGARTYNSLASVQGPYQYLCSTWNHDTNATGNGAYSCSCTSNGQYAGACPAVNDPTISSQVVNAVYANYQQQYGTQCANAGLTWSSCAYAIHVFGATGFTNMLNTYNANPNAPASVLQSTLGSSAYNNNLSIFNNGGTVAGVFGELDRRLGINSGSPVISNIATAASPFNVSPGCTACAVIAPAGYIGSPFSNLSNIYSSSPGTGSYQSSSYGQPIQYSQSAQNSQPIQYPQTLQNNTSASGGISQTTSISGGGYAQTGQTGSAVAQIIAQPKVVSKNSPVTVSWSSAGMSDVSPCQVLENGSIVIATANEGSMLIGTSTVGTLTFSLSCTAQGTAANVQSSASVVVQ